MIGIKLNAAPKISISFMLVSLSLYREFDVDQLYIYILEVLYFLMKYFNLRGTKPKTKMSQNFDR